jgi:uncharacterized protein YjbJ (UPF0337 family)
MNQQTIAGQWNEVKGKLRDRWGQLTDDDLNRYEGKVDQLVGYIQQKTGETRESIEKYVNQTIETGASTISQAAGVAQQYAQKAGEYISEGSQQAAGAVRAGYIQSERYIRKHPFESLSVCFGAGLLMGVALGLTMRSR